MEIDSKTIGAIIGALVLGSGGTGFGVDHLNGSTHAADLAHERQLRAQAIAAEADRLAQVQEAYRQTVETMSLICLPPAPTP